MCALTCARHWGRRSKQDTESPCPHGASITVPDVPQLSAHSNVLLQSPPVKVALSLRFKNPAPQPELLLQMGMQKDTAPLSNNLQVSHKVKLIILPSNPTPIYLS